ncbi:MAG TPA: hypothetical protein VF705_01240 [Longimicrobium sp.]
MIPEYWPDEPSEASGELPKLLERYFNDYERVHTTWPETCDVIIARLLEKGGSEAVRWLRLNVGDDELREFITGRSGRGMHPRRLRYWAGDSGSAGGTRGRVGRDCHAEPMVSADPFR